MNASNENATCVKTDPVCTQIRQNNKKPPICLITDSV